ncbi:MAG TPA: hypothetical protein VF163_16920 [Micromonosporaceae bacterium]
MTDRQLTATLAGSAAASARAPSIHHTQPWRWVVRTRSLDLYADRTRQLTGIDPDGRLVLLGCGGALHYARVALAADGLGVRVDLRPDSDPDHVATLTATGPVAADVRAKELLSAASPLPSPAPAGSPPQAALAALVEAAAAVGVRMRILDRPQVLALAGASSVTRRVRQRIGLDETTVYALLFGDQDTTEAWVRAGEALSAVSLEADRHGLTVYPSWTVVDLPGSREVVRKVLGSEGTPYLALRIGTS